MSGIYIPGMEMPDTCFHCKFNYKTMDSERSVYMECCFGNGTSIISRPSDCPLAEQKHGKWAKTKQEEFLRCSACDGFVLLASISKDFNYCPNCGARMDGANDV